MIFFYHLLLKRKKKYPVFGCQSPTLSRLSFLGTAIGTIPWRSINGTRGVSKAVTLDGIYRPVSNYIIEGLQDRCDEQGVLRRLNDIIAADRVKIERGPFAEYICTVEHIKDEQRAWVLIETLQQQKRAEVSLDDVSKID